uniref:Uncharacterized protein n=1 Tax=Triticum urartu TaxID=4572 RepID=A0A8R7TT80_TRIUA
MMKETIPVHPVASKGSPSCVKSIQGRKNAIRSPHTQNFACPSTLFVEFFTSFCQTREWRGWTWKETGYRRRTQQRRVP